MGAAERRRLWCSATFGLFGWALVELTGGDPRCSYCYRAPFAVALCALFGLSLAKISELYDLPAGDPQDQNPSPQPSPPSPTAYCSICMEPNPLTDTFVVSLCSHSFCNTCINLYVASKLSANSLAINCPEPGCKDGVLDPETCRPVVAREVLDRWELALCEEMIRSKFYCPFKDCSAVLMDDRGDGSEVIREAECPHCHRLFCARCEVPWHAGVSCTEYKKLGKDERAPGDLLVVEMAKTQKWQRCPKCKFYVERNEGCMFMKCRCGFKFCYRCGTETVKDHYCAKCKR